MVDLKKLQEEVMRNKIEKGFNTTNVAVEFCRAYEELSEAYNKHAKGDAKGTAEEFAEVIVEVSLLTPAQPMQFGDEVDALTQLRPNVDGVIFEYSGYRSTFLPQVWENLAQPRQFLAMLKRKAGLPDDFWADGIRLSRYTVTKWSEKEH